MSNLPSYGCNCNEQGFPARILACFEELVQLGKDYFCSCISLIAMEFIIANQTGQCAATKKEMSKYIQAPILDKHTLHLDEHFD